MIAELSKLSLGMSLVAGVLVSAACIEPQAAEPYTRGTGNAVGEDDAGTEASSGGSNGQQSEGSQGGGDTGVGNTGSTQLPSGGTASGSTSGGSSGGGATSPGGTGGGTPTTGTTGGSSGTGASSGGTTGGGSSSGTTGGGTSTPTGPAALTFKVLTTQLGGPYQPKNVGAIWIEDKAGKFVRTVEIWAARREEHLTRFGTASGGDRVDAVASATLSNHVTHTALWNLKDNTGKVVPDGDYQIIIETTDRNGSGDSLAIPFTKGSTAFDKNVPDATHYKTMSLSFK